MPSSHLILCRPLLLLPPIPPSIRVFSSESTLRTHEVAKVLEFQLQHHSLQGNPRADLQNGLVGSLCTPRDSQESSPTPQLKSLNSSALSLLHSQIDNPRPCALASCTKLKRPGQLFPSPWDFPRALPRFSPQPSPLLYEYVDPLSTPGIKGTRTLPVRPSC